MVMGEMQLAFGQKESLDRVTQASLVNRQSQLCLAPRGLGEEGFPAATHSRGSQAPQWGRGKAAQPQEGSRESGQAA